MRHAYVLVTIICLASAVASAQSVKPQDSSPYCLTPYEVQIRCQAGNCRESVPSWTDVLPYQQAFITLDEGQTLPCCGAQIPVNTVGICPGPVPLGLERSELDGLGRTFGRNRVFLRTCRGGYESFSALQGGEKEGSDL